jgi:hypothetical protein
VRNAGAVLRTENPFGRTHTQTGPPGEFIP